MSITLNGGGPLSGGGGGSGGSGNVVGPASATDGAAALFDGATGKLLKDSKLVVTVPASAATLVPTAGTTQTWPAATGTLVNNNAAALTTGRVPYMVSATGLADSPIYRAGTDTVQQSRTTNAQTLCIYNTTDSDASPVNYERACIRWSGNVAQVVSEAAGTGTVRDLRVIGNSKLRIAGGTGVANAIEVGDAGGSTYWAWSFSPAAKPLLPLSDAAYDIGSAAARVRSIYKQGYARNTADVTNATTTFANLSDLSVTLVAGQKYTGLMAGVFSNSTAADGIKLDFNGGTATMTAFSAFGIPYAATAPTVGTPNQTSLAGVINWTAMTGETLIIIYISMVVNAAGTFIPRQAMNASTTGTLTTRLGTYLSLDDSKN